MTPMLEFIEKIYIKPWSTNIYFQDMVNEYLEKERKMIIDAIMYARDEDGHTGDWKIKFANDYYEKLKKEDR